MDPQNVIIERDTDSSYQKQAAVITLAAHPHNALCLTQN